jgi:hypothetical protein
MRCAVAGVAEARVVASGDVRTAIFHIPVTFDIGRFGNKGLQVTNLKFQWYLENRPFALSPFLIPF